MTAPAIPRSTALTEAGREWGKPLTEADARDLTAQIRTSVEELLPLIRTAYQRRADLALGYASWEAYCDAELSGLRLAVADRQEAVAGLRAEGMSTRAIGAALGVSHQTVQRDLASGPDGPVERVTSLDGRDRPASRPTPVPGPTGAALSPPADPGVTPAPAAGSTAESPVPSREPVPGLAQRVWDVLDQHGNPPFGLTIGEIWVKLNGVHSAAIPAALAELAAAGRAVVMGYAQGEQPQEMRARWLNNRATAETPEPTAATPPSPSALARTPEQVEQMVADAERDQAISNARRKAGRLVAEVSGLITEIVSGVRYGEPGLITADMVAGLRAEADRLESYLEGRA